MKFHFLGNARKIGPRALKFKFKFKFKFKLIYSVTNSTFFSQSQDEFKTKESEFVHFGPDTNEVGIDAKGSVKVDCDASIYGEMLFIFINE